ncbi:MAG: YjfB family protein [Phycisphaeraceae bacterium]|nr:YjfB family protein [Phycisphaeraceae bacterium]
MDSCGTDGLAASLMGMQQGKLQYEVGLRVAAKALDVERSQGEAMVGMVTAAAKVMEAGQKAIEKGALDLYA